MYVQNQIKETFPMHKRSQISLFTRYNTFFASEHVVLCKLDTA